MANNYKTIRITERTRQKRVRIETPLGVFIIYTDLTDADGDRVERVDFKFNPNSDSVKETEIATDRGVRAFRVVHTKDESKRDEIQNPKKFCGMCRKYRRHIEVCEECRAY